MTSRIFAAFLTLTFALLLGALLPLGFTMAGQYEHDYQQSTLGVAHTLAASAEERLADGESSTGLRRTLGHLRETDAGGPGLEMAAIDDDGHVIDASDPHLPDGDRAGPALDGRTHVSRDGDRLIAVVPVGGHDEKVAGAVLLSRPLAPLDARVDRLWTGLAVATLVAVALAAVLAVALARWVSRPLHRLETAAESLGGGELDTRAEPPRRPAEIRRLTQRFNVMATRLQELVHDNRTMLADVSHQLRTPLAALRLRLELLADDPDPAEFAAALDEVARLGRLVDGLLVMARAEDTTPVPEPVDVPALLRDRADAWRPVAADRDVRLEVQVPFELTALAGPGHLDQILDNLIDNALAVMSQDGRITLAATRAGDQAQITVADNGPGMSDRAKRDAFHRFHGGRTTGTGLGLAIVHRLITTDEGDVRLSDTEGGGLTVTIALPRSG